MPTDDRSVRRFRALTRRPARRRSRRLPEHVYRRRRIVAGGFAASFLSALAIGAELAAFEPIPASVDAAAALPSECRGDLVADARSQLGRRLVVRMEQSATGSLRRQARRGEIGGVILFPAPGTSTRGLAGEIDRLQRAARRGGHLPLVVSVDQEGGSVKRIADAPPDASAAELGTAGDPSRAEAQGRATGARLARIGVNVDLAPVLDVAGPGSFLGDRSFGSRPGTVARLGVAFARGLAAGGVVATAKHFPGLGRATANTDVGPSAVEASRSTIRAEMAPFRQAVRSGIGMVMLSAASYPALNADGPAMLSARIARDELRDRVGFDGVTVTDDLDAGAITRTMDRRTASVAAAVAGVDLLLFAQTPSPGVLDALVSAARDGTLPAASLTESCARVVRLRRGFG